MPLLVPLLWIGGGVGAFYLVKGEVSAALALRRPDGSLNPTALFLWGGMALAAYYTLRRA